MVLRKRIVSTFFIFLISLIFQVTAAAACCNTSDIGVCSASGCSSEQECVSSNTPGVGLDACRRQNKATCANTSMCICESTVGGACGSAANNKHCCEGLGLICGSRNNPVCIKNTACSANGEPCTSHPDCCSGLECLDVPGQSLGQCGSSTVYGGPCNTNNACYPSACNPGQCCYCTGTGTSKACYCQSQTIFEEKYEDAYNEATGNIHDVPYTGPFFSSFTQVITPIVKILFYGGLLIGVAFIVYSGYIIMTSEGSPDRVQQGKEHLTASILGTMFILLSAAILRVIINLIS